MNPLDQFYYTNKLSLREIAYLVYQFQVNIFLISRSGRIFLITSLHKDRFVVLSYKDNSMRYILYNDIIDYKLFNPQSLDIVIREKLEFLLYLKDVCSEWDKQKAQKAYQLARISPFFKNTFILCEFQELNAIYTIILNLLKEVLFLEQLKNHPVYKPYEDYW